jgi:hypothetical protein
MPEGINLATEGIDALQKSILMFEKKTKNRIELSFAEKLNILKNYQ